jgi:hypothetical protein
MTRTGSTSYPCGRVAPLFFLSQGSKDGKAVANSKTHQKEFERRLTGDGWPLLETVALQLHEKKPKVFPTVQSADQWLTSIYKSPCCPALIATSSKGKPLNDSQGKPVKRRLNVERDRRPNAVGKLVPRITVDPEVAVHCTDRGRG